MTRKLALAVVPLGLGLLAQPALAGPPYLTDDPVPTDTGHWEIYAFTAGEGRGPAFDGDAGVDLNYGAVRGVQLTSTLPLGLSQESGSGWRTGTGDVELGVKYRFIEDQKNGFSAAIFPRVILPTSTLATGERTRFLLPLWLEKDFGRTSVFGGGGYLTNPGAGNRDFWQAAIAVTHEFDKALSAGAELTRQGADTIGTTAQTRAGIGAVIGLSEHYNLLFSGGPTWSDHRTGYHFYAALGLNF